MRCAKPRHDVRRRAGGTGFALLASLASVAHGQTWPAFAGGPARVSIAPAVANSIALPRWLLSQTDGGALITFAGQAGVVATTQQTFATGKIANVWNLISASASTGQFLWASPIPAPLLESWSTPAIDGKNATVLVGSGQYLTAYDALNGDQVWQTPLGRYVVNASPLVTTDLGAANRALITTYNGTGTGSPAQLLCINADPFDSVLNPYHPGDIVWSVPIPASSGNSPAYRGGIVYCSAVSDSPGSQTGRIFARRITDDPSEPDLWSFTNDLPDGYFSGVCIADTAAGPAVFAASYAFYGDLHAATLVKLNATTGEPIWSVPCNRTSSTPVPLPDGRILLSGGVTGYGSVPTIELFAADGSLLWDSAIATWVDANQNGSIDPGEYLRIGGWTQQPLASSTRGSWRLWTGAIDGTSTSSPSTDLYILDFGSGPESIVSIVGHFVGAGSTPAAAGGWLYTVGAGGLYAFVPDCYANCDNSTAPPILNANDFQCFLNRYAVGSSIANCDGSTSPPILNANDFQCFINMFAVGCP